MTFLRIVFHLAVMFAIARLCVEVGLGHDLNWFDRATVVLWLGYAIVGRTVPDLLDALEGAR